MHKLIRETRNAIVDKVVKSLELDTKDVADVVELYYDCQKLRTMHANKERSEGVGHLISWLAYWLEIGEKVIHKKLQNWVESDKSQQETKWAYDQDGIGPVIASGLAAHIDVTKADNPSSLWKFAGLAPGFDRKAKGVKLPYNARLKTLCWKLGESFVKVSGKEGATYGKLYAEFKREEIRRNDAGLLAEQAKRELARKKIKEAATKKTLESGKLIDAHLHSRAKRKAVKIFLSHYWVKGREARGLSVSEPYAIAILKHDGKIEPTTERNPLR
jgi:hypothetical protein